MTAFDRDIATVQKISAVPRILDVVCRTTGMGFAAVARVTDKDWIACEVLDNVHFGLAAGGELPIKTTLCNEVRAERREIVIDHVAEDLVYRDHHTPRTYGLQSYISVPIVLSDGSFFGTLCAIDSKPAKLNNPETLGMFRLFAELIGYHLDAADKLNESRAEIENQRGIAELREQFIAVLGHDLRNPLMSIQSGAAALSREPQTERANKLLGLIQKSSLRMGNLIDNVLDFARGRMGGGIGLSRDGTRPLGSTLEQVVSEIRAIHPERDIVMEAALGQPIAVDHGRIGQLFSNLLGNAVTHGDPLAPIHITAAVADGQLEIAVANGGAPIPPDRMQKLFDPFTRGGGHNPQGLGLGLYIAAQIAQAHDGRIDVVSNAQETKFTFRMPT